MMTWSTKERTKYVDASHNACFYTVTNRPWYLLVACKPIARGEKKEEKNFAGSESHVGTKYRKARPPRKGKEKPMGIMRVAGLA
jgi:hypothetical protein